MINKEHRQGLSSMRMHGQFPRQTAELIYACVEGGNKWLHTAHLRPETESFTYAAQEQALATNVMKSKVWRNGGTGLCRLCCKHDETIMHIVSGCEILCKLNIFSDTTK